MISREALDLFLDDTLEVSGLDRVGIKVIKDRIRHELYEEVLRDWTRIYVEKVLEKVEAYNNTSAWDNI